MRYRILQCPLPAPPTKGARDSVPQQHQNAQLASIPAQGYGTNYRFSVRDLGQQFKRMESVCLKPWMN